MQEKYADSDKFSVVISFAQQLDDAGREYLRENAPAIPAYDQLNPPDAPCGKGIPDAYLFDHTGKIVRRGHPAQLYDLVAGLVEAAPDPVPAELLADFEPRLLNEQAQALADEHRPAAPVVEELEALADADDARAEEAREILERVRTWMPAEVERMERVALRRPASTAWRAEGFAARFEGVDPALVARAEELHEELAGDKHVKLYLRGMADVDRARACDDPKRRDQFLRRARKVLEKLADDAKAPAAVREDAREAARAAT